MGELVEDLKTLIRTRHAIVTIRTTEEDFAARMICEAAQGLQLPVVEWSVSDGLRQVGPIALAPVAGTDLIAQALRAIRGNPRNTVYIFKDALRHLEQPTPERLLRDVAAEFARDNRTIFMLDSAGRLPDSLHPFAVPYEVALPEEKEILAIVQRTVRELLDDVRGKVTMDRQQMRKFLANLRGLTRMEISQLVAEAVLADRQLGPEDVDRAVEFKKRRLRQTGVLDYIPPPESEPRVGGMENLRKWLARRAEALTPAAREYGLEPPRGILLLGVQGCGKSLMARFVAAQWRLPLLRLDVGALYDKYIGETERHLRTAFRVASAMAPCVLWIDEIEKAFASAGVGPDAARSDGGLSQRMFGQLLTWMQDHADPVFMVATANDVLALPPELLRKGRFDEIFFVDLPAPPARRAIFEIHLARRNRDPGKFDLDALSAASEGFSGAEIEQVVVAALYAAFAERRELTTQDVLREVAATRPVSVLMAEKVAALRAWANGRCVGAD